MVKSFPNRHPHLLRPPDRTDKHIFARKLIRIIFSCSAWTCGPLVRFFRTVPDNLIQELLDQACGIRQKRQGANVQQLNAFIETVVLEPLLVRIGKQHICPEHATLVFPRAFLLIHNCIPITVHRINIVFFRPRLFILLVVRSTFVRRIQAIFSVKNILILLDLSSILFLQG
ncbi:hypothetical protein D3C75_626870 [compost metagenome]